MDPYEFKDHTAVIKMKKKSVRKGRVKDAMCIIKTTSKQRIHMTLDKVVERHMAYHRVLYPFLPNSQIKGVTLKTLGLPNSMGDIPRSPGKTQLAKWWTAELSINSLAMFNYSKLLRQFVSKSHLSGPRSLCTPTFDRSTFANDSSPYQNLSSCSEAHISDVSSDEEWQAPCNNINCSIEVERNVITKTRYEEKHKQVVVTSINYNEEIRTTVNGFMEINNDSSSDVPVSRIKKQKMSRKRSSKSAKSKTLSKNSAEEEYNFFELSSEGNPLTSTEHQKEDQQRNFSTRFTQEITNTKVQRKLLPEYDVITSDFKDSDASSERDDFEKVKHCPKKKKLALNKCTKKTTVKKQNTDGSPKILTIKSPSLIFQDIPNKTLDDVVNESPATLTSKDSRSLAEHTPVKINTPDNTSKVKKQKKRKLALDMMTEKKEANEKKSLSKSKARKSLRPTNNLNLKTNNNDQVESDENPEKNSEMTVNKNDFLGTLNDQKIPSKESDETQDDISILEHTNQSFDHAIQLFATPLLSHVNNLFSGKSPKIEEENCIREDGEIDVPCEPDVDLSINTETPKTLKFLHGDISSKAAPEIEQQVETNVVEKLPSLQSDLVNVSDEVGEMSQKSSNNNIKVKSAVSARKKNKLKANSPDIKSVQNSEPESKLETVDIARPILNNEAQNNVFANPENDLEQDQNDIKNQKKSSKKSSVGKKCTVLSSFNDNDETIAEQSKKSNNIPNLKVSKALSNINQNLNISYQLKTKKLKNVKRKATPKTVTCTGQTVTNKKSHETSKTKVKVSEGRKDTSSSPLEIVSEIENIENLQSYKRFHKSSEGICNIMTTVSNTVSEEELDLDCATVASSTTKKQKASVGVKIMVESEVELESNSELSSDEAPQANIKTQMESFEDQDTPSSKDSIAVRPINEQLYVCATPDSSTGSSTIQISITPKTAEIVENSEEDYADDEAFEMESLFSKKTTKSNAKFVAMTPRSCHSEVDSIVCNRYGKKQHGQRGSLNLPQINSVTKVSRFLNRLGQESNSQESYLSSSTDFSVSLAETDRESGCSVLYKTKSYAQSECSVRSVLANLFDPCSEAGSTHTSVAGTPTLNNIEKSMLPPKSKPHSKSKKK